MVTGKIPSYIKTVYISLLIIIILFFMIMAKKILVPLLISGYISMLMIPFCNLLENYKIPRSLSAFTALIIFIVLVAGVFALIFFQFRSFIDDLESHAIEKLNSFALNINTAIEGFCGMDLGLSNGLDAEKVLAIVKPGGSNTELLLMTIGTLSSMLLVPVFIFFMLIYRDHLSVFVTKVFEKQRNKTLIEHIVSIRLIVHAYIVGAGKVMLILGVVNTTVLFSLGIKHAIFFGMTAGLLNIIPYLGPMIGACMPFLFALLTKDSLFYPVAVVVSFTIIQFLEGTFLTPKITGANVKLNAFVTFVGLLIGGAIWGIVGMILIIPTIAILKRLFELNPETEPYAYLFGEEDTRWFRRVIKKQQ